MFIQFKESEGARQVDVGGGCRASHVSEVGIAQVTEVVADELTSAVEELDNIEMKLQDTTAQCARRCLSTCGEARDL